MVVGFAGALERYPQNPAQVRREGRRQDGRALDDAGIAVGRLLADAGALDQRHRHPAPRQLQGD